ncbi:MAG: sugar ABC transporter ATP-binding protein [Solirubrobacteraceae bacterium]
MAPIEQPASATAHVALAGISKSFGGVEALSEISLEVRRGEVHALVGENGAGKSTLGRIIAGALVPDAGELRVDGEHVAFRSPREALQHGIAAIAQEVMIVPGLTVAENVFLGAEPRAAGWVRRDALRRRYQALAADAGFTLPADRPAGSMRLAEQQQVEILRGLAREANLIVMDEPSAALSGRDIDHLHEIIRSLASRGHTVLLVSHFLKEVLELADTVSVLRDGHLVQSGAAGGETEDSLIRAMLGRPLGAAFPRKTPVDGEAPVALSVRGLSAQGVSEVSLEVRAREIVGLAGLVGAGRTELARAIFGADRRLSGVVVLSSGRIEGGETLRRDGPLESLRRGLAMLPESRRDQGLLFGRSVVENVTLSSLHEHSRVGVVNRRSERAAADSILQRVALRGATGGSMVGTLSGGNQQKVLFARLLMCRPRVLIADEPTRGVDVGAKRAIYDLIVGLAQEGTAVLMISSEVEEVLGLAHRVLVMRQGRVVKELADSEMSESAILAAAFSGGSDLDQAA